MTSSVCVPIEPEDPAIATRTTTIVSVCQLGASIGMHVPKQLNSRAEEPRRGNTPQEV